MLDIFVVMEYHTDNDDQFICRQIPFTSKELAKEYINTHYNVEYNPYTTMYKPVDDSCEWIRSIAIYRLSVADSVKDANSYVVWR